MDMGTGKTAVTITTVSELLDCFDIRGAMVFAPLRVATIAWPEEFRKWDEFRSLKHMIVRGSADDRVRQLRTPAAFHILNYELMPWWVEWVAGECKAKRPLLQDMLVLDESSRVKSSDSSRFRCLKPMADSKLFPRIVELTGTPSPEDYADLWSQYRLLDGGKALEPYVTHFRNKYYVQNPYSRYDLKMIPGAEVVIQNRIAPITFTARAEDFLSLPPILENTIYVDLPPDAQRIYDEFESDMVATIDGEDVAAVNPAIVSEKCRQACSGGVYNEAGVVTRLHVEKFEALDELCEDLGARVVVAYWYKHEMDTIRQRYPTARCLGPKESTAAALRTVQDWNAGKISRLFVHPASVGHGLNLQQGGHHLVWLTTPWSNELYQQLVGRLHRSGQEHPVMVHRILCRNTVDVLADEAVKNKELNQKALRKALASLTHNPL